VADERPARRQRRRHVVCRVDELPPGEMKMVPVGKFGVGVFNVAGTFHALSNYCPHEGGPLCVGYLRGTTVESATEAGGVGWIRDGEILRCPWHQWEFDIMSGETLSTPTRRVRTYAVEVVDGDVVVLG
jgi:nitrite reductase/ring-hydroxylating ferredoxin subunit